MELILNIVFISLSGLSGLSFVLLLITSSSFDEYIAPLDKKEFLLCDIYGVGFNIIKLFGMKFASTSANQTRENVTVLYGERYADYYLRVYYAQRISLTYLIFAVGCAICTLAEGTDKLIMLGLVIIVCIVLYFYTAQLPSERVNRRAREFMNEFPNAVSTIALLVNSGMVLRDAWDEVARSGDSELYEEMRKVNYEINNGTSETDALYNFGRRCVSPEIKKFTSLVVQGLEKGNRDLSNTLRNQADELWTIKRQNAVKQGELASGKLMIPLMISFIGILIMIMGPILSNLNI